MTIQNIVSVTISRETSAPTAAGFGTLLLLGANVAAGSMASYASLAEVADDFTSSDAEYKAAQAYFGQAKKPGTLKMFKAVPVGGVFILKQAAAATISLKLNGQTVSGADLAAIAVALAALDDVSSADVADTNYIVVKMTAGYTATVTDLTAGSGTIALIQGNISGWSYGTGFDTLAEIDIDGVTESSATSYQDLVDEAIGNVALDVADGVALNNEIYLVSDTEDVPNVLTDGQVNSVAAGAVVACGTITMGDLLDDAVDADPDFYGIALTTYSPVNVLSIAAWAESNGKLFATRSDAAGCLVAGTSTDILSLLSALNLNRTIGIYHGNAASEYIDAALFGRNFPEDPGSLTWNLTQLSLVTADSLTSAQKTAVRGKNGNTFTTVKGVAVFEDGRVASGEWIDIMRGIDWHVARLEERIFTTTLNKPKVPYTNKGTAIIEADVRAEVAVAQRQGLFAEDPAPTFTREDVSDQSSSDRTSRIYPGISYTAKVAGAIHDTQIQGTVSS